VQKNAAVIMFIAFFDMLPSTHAPLFSMHDTFSTLVYGTTVVDDSKSFQNALGVLVCHLRNLQFPSNCAQPVHQSTVHQYQYHIRIRRQISQQRQNAASTAGIISNSHHKSPLHQTLIHGSLPPGR